MKIFQTFETSKQNTAVALGYFDGVHLAHQKVINTMASYERKGFYPTVLTFSIDISLPNKAKMKTILCDETKLEVFARHGVMQTYMPPFSMLMELSPSEFFTDILVNKLKAKVIVCGYDYTFGKGALGNTDLLAELCHQHEIKLIVINPFLKNGVTISSTKIRKYIKEGNFPLVNELLGYKYFLKGQVVHGNNIGKTLGFPTANMEFKDEQVIPQYGVYETNTFIGDQVYKSITNVGIKPTIEGIRKPLAETHIIDFDQNLYGECLVVNFTKMIRKEQKFDSLQELKSAIAHDMDNI